ARRRAVEWWATRRGTLARGGAGRRTPAFSGWRGPAAVGLPGNQPLLEQRAFGVARDLRAGLRILVFSAGTPVPAATARRPSPFDERAVRVVGRRPQPSPLEPHQRHIGLRALKLFERRDQLLRLACP